MAISCSTIHPLPPADDPPPPPPADHQGGRRRRRWRRRRGSPEQNSDQVAPRDPVVVRLPVHSRLGPPLSLRDIVGSSIHQEASPTDALITAVPEEPARVAPRTPVASTLEVEEEDPAQPEEASIQDTPAEDTPHEGSTGEEEQALTALIPPGPEDPVHAAGTLGAPDTEINSSPQSEETSVRPVWEPCAKL